MWFSPDDLLTPSANSANSANPALQISKLARLADPLPVKTSDSSLEISKLAELADPFNSEINIDDRQRIINWLASIGEDDQEMIKETIDRCKADPETLAYFCQRANEPRQL